LRFPISVVPKLGTTGEGLVGYLMWEVTLYPADQPGAKKYQKPAVNAPA